MTSGKCNVPECACVFYIPKEDSANKCLCEHFINFHLTNNNLLVDTASVATNPSGITKESPQGLVALKTTLIRESTNAIKKRKPKDALAGFQRSNTKRLDEFSTTHVVTGGGSKKRKSLELFQSKSDVTRSKFDVELLNGLRTLTTLLPTLVTQQASSSTMGGGESPLHPPGVDSATVVDEILKDEPVNEIGDSESDDESFSPTTSSLKKRLSSVYSESTSRRHKGDGTERNNERSIDAKKRHTSAATTPPAKKNKTASTFVIWCLPKWNDKRIPFEASGVPEVMKTNGLIKEILLDNRPLVAQQQILENFPVLKTTGYVFLKWTNKCLEPIDFVCDPNESFYTFARRFATAKKTRLYLRPTKEGYYIESADKYDYDGRSPSPKPNTRRKSKSKSLPLTRRSESVHMSSLTKVNMDGASITSTKEMNPESLTANVASEAVVESEAFSSEPRQISESKDTNSNESDGYINSSSDDSYNDESKQLHGTELDLSDLIRQCQTSSGPSKPLSDTRMSEASHMMGTDGFTTSTDILRIDEVTRSVPLHKATTWTDIRSSERLPHRVDCTTSGRDFNPSAPRDTTCPELDAILGGLLDFYGPSDRYYLHIDKSYSLSEACGVFFKTIAECEPYQLLSGFQINYWEAIDVGGQEAAMITELVKLLKSNELPCPNFEKGILRKAEYGNYYTLVDMLPTNDESKKKMLVPWEMKALGRLMLYMMAVHRSFPTFLDPVIIRYFLDLPFDLNVVGEYAPTTHNIIKRISQFPESDEPDHKYGYLRDLDLKILLNEWKYQDSWIENKTPKAAMDALVKSELFGPPGSFRRKYYEVVHGEFDYFHHIILNKDQWDVIERFLFFNPITAQMIKDIIKTADSLPSDFYGSTMHRLFLEWLDDVEKRDPERPRDVLRFVCGNDRYPPKAGQIEISYAEQRAGGKGIFPLGFTCGSQICMFYGFPKEELLDFKRTTWRYFELYLTPKSDGNLLGYK